MHRFGPQIAVKALGRVSTALNSHRCASFLLSKHQFLNTSKGQLKNVVYNISRCYSVPGLSQPPSDTDKSGVSSILTNSGTQSTNEASNHEVTAFYKNYDITVKGRNIPRPILTLNEYQWPQEVMEYFVRSKFENPTPIQSIGWPVALAGSDLIGISQTGSGKTLSYMLPALVHIQKNKRADSGPIALIVAPTRELAQQIDSVARTCIRSERSVCVFGGASKDVQARNIQRMNPKIIIGTPGRLNDFLTTGGLNLSDVSFLVLDEADRMLDMGFEPQMRQIVSHLTSSERQTLMWSATWPQEVRQLANDFLKDPVQIQVGGTSLRANHDITQVVEVCHREEKMKKFLALLAEIQTENERGKILVFAQTKKTVDYLGSKIQRLYRRVLTIHGDKSQRMRDAALNAFRNSDSAVLVATDVAARGLDVDDIDYVINFDYPNTAEDYIHRIGRTGRRNKKGTAYTFITPMEQGQASGLIDVLEEANQPVNPQLITLANTRTQRKRPINRYLGGRRPSYE